MQAPAPVDDNAPGAEARAAQPPAPPPPAPDAAARRTRALVVASVVALAALGLAWEGWLAPTGSGALALKVLPLLPALPGLMRYRLYTYRWLSLLVWCYAGEGVLRATTERGTSAGLAWAQVALSLLIFTGCVLHVRGRLQRGTR